MVPQPPGVPPYPGPGYPGGAIPVGPGYVPIAQQRPTKKSGCGVAAIVIALLGGVVLLVGGGVAWYYFGASGSKVPSVAHEHLPEDCDVAARLDMTELMKVGPVKKHVVAAIEEVAKEEGGGRLAAFLVAARMDPKKDLSEVAVCLNDVKAGADPDYGIIVGGKLLDENGLIKAMDKHDGADEFKDPVEVGKLLVLEDREDGVLVSQSPEDAAWIIGNDKASLKSVAETGEAYESYDIPMDEHIVAVVSQKTIAAWLSGLGPMLPGMDALNKVKRAILTLTLDPGELGVQLQMPDAESASSAATALTSGISMLAAAPFGPTSDPEVKKALNGAKVKAKGKEVLVTFPIAEETIEEKCEEIADKIREENE